MHYDDTLTLSGMVFVVSYGPKNFSKDFNAYRGNTLGHANTDMQSLLKPSMHSKVANLVFAGHMTHPGSGRERTI